MNFLSDFGVQPILLAAQAVNFLVLLLILNKFLYKPILKTLNTRKQAIAKSLQETVEIEKRLAKTEEESARILEKSAKEAQAIIQEATTTGNQIIEEAHLKAAQDIKSLVESARENMKLEQNKLNQEIRATLADLIAAGLKSISGKVLTDKDKVQLTKDSIKNLS